MSTNFNALSTQKPINSPTLRDGNNAGAVFNGRGNDFLSPKSILKDVDGFAQSVTPIQSNNPVDQLITPSILGKNPQARNVLRTTDATIDNILSPNFGSALFSPAAGVAPIATAPTGTPVAGTPVENSSLSGTSIVTLSPALVKDLSSFNPLIWINPSSTNILLGTMDAQNKIFGGSGIIPPFFSQAPLFPFIRPNIPPFEGANVNTFTPLPQAKLFPTVFLSGQSPFQVVFIPTPSPINGVPGISPINGAQGAITPGTITPTEPLTTPVLNPVENPLNPPGITPIENPALPGTPGSVILPESGIPTQGETISMPPQGGQPISGIAEGGTTPGGMPVTGNPGGFFFYPN